METYFKHMHDAMEQLSEKHSVVTEAYSDSMPGWLRSRINDTKRSTRNRWSRTNPDYISPRGSNEEGWELGLFNQFLKQGIDLNSVDVITAPKPLKSSDPLLADPYIPIFLFDNGQVYARGINDNEKYRDDPNQAPFKYLSNKRLLDLAQDFCYIDRSKIDPSILLTKQQQRRDLQQELKQLSTYRQKDGWGRDKSGYKRDTNRYKEKLKELRASKITEIMEDAAAQLDDCRLTFSALILDDDLEAASKGVYELADSFRTLINYYNRAVNEVESILSSSEDDESKKYSLMSMFNNYGSITKLRDALNNFKRESEMYKSVVLDW